jgi:hypothetical protein
MKVFLVLLCWPTGYVDAPLTEVVALPNMETCKAVGNAAVDLSKYPRLVKFSCVPEQP